MTGALRHPLRKGKGTDDIRREFAFLRSNRRRMECADADACHPIGSGSVETANRVLVTSRMKCSGQGPGRGGGWKPQSANNNRPAAQVAIAA